LTSKDKPAVKETPAETGESKEIFTAKTGQTGKKTPKNKKGTQKAA
jgi:hypothetical protein